MARPLRIEFPGAIYHVTVRGDRREDVFVDEGDRRTLLAIIARALRRFDANVWAYCLMDNHFHLVVQTGRANLSRVMRQINGVYTQAFNVRHGVSGHLFQGRYHAIVVDREAYLLEVCRYVELNPVRAGLVTRPDDWRWSSYLAHAGRVKSPPWLDSMALYAFLLGREVRAPGEVRVAAGRYAELVGDGCGIRLWDVALRQQIYLGDEAFVERMQAKVTPVRRSEKEIPVAHRRSPRTLQEWLAASPSLEDALLQAHVHSGLSMSQMARALGLSVSRVSRLIRLAEDVAEAAAAAKGKT